MSSQPDPSKHIPNKKRLYFSLAASGGVLALLLVTIGLLWALPDTKLPRQHEVAATPTKMATTKKTPTATATPRPGTPTATATTAQPTPAPTVTPVATTAGASVPIQVGATPTSAGSTGTVSVGSLLHGTNLTLNDAGDQALNSSATQAMLQQMHVGIVRIPLRPSLSEATMLQAARIVKSIGASPLIILERPESGISTAIANDSTLIKDMNAIFGNQVVYYEYGNEPNLAGFPGGSGDPAPYVASWNKNVPVLKKLANNARFIGPSMYQYVASYLSAFLQGAKPLPDFVSWHEYTCASWDAAAYCLQHLDNWAMHDASANSVMVSAIGTTIPIMITEWNYTANYSVAGDGKHDNTTFMTQWTTKALQVLANNGIYAAMQYSCTNTQIPLVNPDNTASMQGAVFQASGG
jgi:hypothetical protein